MVKDRVLSCFEGDFKLRKIKVNVKIKVKCLVRHLPGH